MMASSAKEPFDSPDWIFETKLDGFRAIAGIDSTGKPGCGRVITYRFGKQLTISALPYH